MSSTLLATFRCSRPGRERTRRSGSRCPEGNFRDRKSGIRSRQWELLPRQSRSSRNRFPRPLSDRPETVRKVRIRLRTPRGTAIHCQLARIGLRSLASSRLRLRFVPNRLSGRDRGPRRGKKKNGRTQRLRAQRGQSTGPCRVFAAGVCLAQSSQESSHLLRHPPKWGWSRDQRGIIQRLNSDNPDPTRVIG